MNNLMSERFGKLKVIARAENYIAPSGKYQLAQWKCLCDCGNTTIVTGSNLKRGNTTSCGCEAIKTRSINGKRNKKYNRFSIDGKIVTAFDNQGNSFIFDFDDFNKVSKHYWSVNNNTGYVSATINGKSILLSRYIMESVNDGILIDHKNHILTDNRKENLRRASKSENCRNSKIQVNNTSGFPGVSWNKKSEKWISYIYVNNVRKYLGTFDDKNEAIKERIKAEHRYFGEFSYLNSVGGKNERV